MISYEVIRHKIELDSSILEEYETEKEDILFYRCFEWIGC